MCTYQDMFFLPFSQQGIWKMTKGRLLMERKLRSWMIAFFCMNLVMTFHVFAAEEDARHWDANYAKRGYRYGLHNLPVLDSWQPLLKSRAEGNRALDIACGEGQNSMALARLGYIVDCVDISTVGLSKTRTLARIRHLSHRIHTIQADLDDYRLAEGRYACIINIRFFMRHLSPHIVRALEPGGIFILETFTEDDVKAHYPEANPAHFLKRNEALYLFRDLFVLHYSERMESGRAVVTLVARKPGPDVGLEHSLPSYGGNHRTGNPCCDVYSLRQESNGQQHSQGGRSR